MGKKRRISTAALVLVAVSGLLWLVLRPHGPPDPVYEGKPVSYWIRHPKTHFVYDGPATIEWPAMDSNAVPFLVKEMERKDRLSQETYLRFSLKMPRWLRDSLPAAVDPSTLRRNSARALATITIGAEAAIPAWLRILKDNKDASLRSSAAHSLGKIGQNDPRINEALVHALKGDTDAWVRLQTAVSLGEIGEGDQKVTEALVCALKEDNDFQMRTVVLTALGSVGKNDPRVTAALLEALSDKESVLRDLAGRSLKQINPEAAAKAGIE